MIFQSEPGEHLAKQLIIVRTQDANFADEEACQQPKFQMILHYNRLEASGPLVNIICNKEGKCSKTLIALKVKGIKVKRS